ncbi:hypothetical protein N9V74_04895 [Alteromonas sp.]|nr:hypothetical protein [Alteromonas sp.]
MLGFVGVILLSLAVLPEQLWLIISPWHAFPLIAFVLGSFYYAYGYKTFRHNDVFTLTSNAKLRPLIVCGKDIDAPDMQIHGSSLMFPWGIALNVACVKHHLWSRRSMHYRWVLKSECTNADYRRLCRAVIFAQKQI